MTARTLTDLIVTLDRTDPRSLPVQLADGIRAQITRGTLGPGDAVPSTRHLAQRLGISRGTAVAAFDQLLAEGYLQAQQGKPTTVHPGLERIHPHRSETPPSAPTPTHHPGTTTTPHQLVADLRPGQPDSSRVAGSAWRAAWRHAAAQNVEPSGDPQGLPSLRAAVAEHLRLMRALPVTPESVIVTAGAREGLTLLLAAAAQRNGRSHLRVGLESPGHPGLRDVPGAHGHSVVPCSVDQQGLRVDLLPVGQDAPDVLIVTPSHQYPLGGSLTLERRLELLEWAKRWDVLVVEDDFDSELRYVGAPLPTLSALDTTGQQVALLGTFSTVLTPALATGYVAVPENLRGGVVELRTTLGTPVAAVTQFAVAHLLTSGHVRRHTQRMRTAYSRRRDTVQAAFGQTSCARLVPMHGGIDAVIHTELSEDLVVQRCAAAGLRVGRQSNYWAWESSSSSETVSADGPHGIVVGFAQADDNQLRNVLPKLLAACTPDQP
ncbi:MocR-like pyridoxine biosynthesis transcription factor PdxR [Kocuria sp.]|uniref:MocR-like pyridoxine biosynthesis transcription factor PdxR n=1 Tax=Kocuria sp. TaxID=1871328 RepID=UPI0026E0B7D7|nr:PLP-dependent aminotransferase family protein [Kocuria sp.]MDO5618877.1 PLP-dependent aminotransferase family protein [Kocuria sp.]